MKHNISRKKVMVISKVRRPCLLALAAILALAAAPVPAKVIEKPDSYLQTNLVSDLAGVAQLQDTSLVNAWGISFNPTGPFWISDNGSGLSTLYAVTNDADGVYHVAKQGLEVAIPGEGSVTGQVFNNTPDFNGDPFIFASEDGTISGWRSALGSAAEILVSRPGTVYKGITLVTNAGPPLLLAANFSAGTIDVYDTNLNLTTYADPRAPEGYAPFNIQVIRDFIFVTFAKQDEEGEDDVPGDGHGFIDLFSPRTGRFHRFATGSDAGGRLDAINSPWGVALAPRGFGRHGDRLLVGNFGSGTIMVFNAGGHFEGFLQGPDNQPIVINGLWGLTFGNDGRAGVSDALYFTAGPNGEADGLFGSIVPAPAMNKHHKY